MSDGPITSIIRHVRFVGPEDGLSKATSMLRASQVQAIPVTENGRVVGLITEAAVLARLSSPSAQEDAVGKIMDRNPPCANIYMSIEQAADMMNTTKSQTLPVIDEFGSYRGVVTRSDVLAALLNVLRPSVVAGMATPLGVHLTTGGVSAGAGSLGLYLAGVALMLMMEAAQVALWLGALAADGLFGTHLAVLIASPSTGTLRGAMGIDAVHNLSIALQLGLMLVFLRLSPMSSYHAAEHQVVHTIEAGESLSPEIVARMPRAHPRCGTNLMAAAAIFYALVDRLGSGPGVFIAVLVVLLGWRTVGYYLQQYVTTKPPGEKHIKNGIKVGEELLARYRRDPNKPVDGWTRIWNMGIVQVALGFATVLSIDTLLHRLWGMPGWF